LWREAEKMIMKFKLIILFLFSLSVVVNGQVKTGSGGVHELGQLIKDFKKGDISTNGVGKKNKPVSEKKVLDLIRFELNQTWGACYKVKIKNNKEIFEKIMTLLLHVHGISNLELKGKLDNFRQSCEKSNDGITPLSVEKELVSDKCKFNFDLTDYIEYYLSVAADVSEKDLLKLLKEVNDEKASQK
jgi:hypothetical protein